MTVKTREDVAAKIYDLQEFQGNGFRINLHSRDGRGLLFSSRDRKEVAHSLGIYPSAIASIDLDHFAENKKLVQLAVSIEDDSSKPRDKIRAAWRDLKQLDIWDTLGYDRGYLFSVAQTTDLPDETEIEPGIWLWAGGGLLPIEQIGIRPVALNRGSIRVRPLPQWMIDKARTVSGAR